MNSNRKDVVTGLIVILIVIGGIYLYKNSKTSKVLPIATSPASFEFKKEFEDNFKLDIPDDANTVQLKDVSGGDARGVATETEILVDANDPEIGYFYEAWLENPTERKTTLLGKLKTAKGGWLLEYSKPTDSGYSKVIVSLEKINDTSIEKRILEGSF